VSLVTLACNFFRLQYFGKICVGQACLRIMPSWLELWRYVSSIYVFAAEQCDVNVCTSLLLITRVREKL